MRLAKEIAKVLSDSGIATADKFHGCPIADFDQEKAASIIAAKLDPIKRAFLSIVKLDKTQTYEYGQAAPSGDLPPGGDRWVTPRERAQAALAMLSEEEE